MKRIVKISGMSCEHCVRSVKSGLAKLSDDATVSVVNGEAVILSDKPISDSDLKNCIENLGFDVLSIDYRE